jgi:hypothetical protein
MSIYVKPTKYFAIKQCTQPRLTIILLITNPSKKLCLGSLLETNRMQYKNETSHFPNNGCTKKTLKASYPPIAANTCNKFLSKRCEQKMEERKMGEMGE